MPTIKLDDPSKLGSLLKQAGAAMPRVMRNASLGAARRGQALMPKKGPTDQGQLRNSWRVREVPDVALVNDAPHAGIVEAGARPHPVSREGIDALTGWAMRQLGVSEKEARGIAFAIAARMKTEGQEPTYFIRDSLAELRDFLRPEVVRQLERLFAGEIKP
jgi:nucleoid-associated protein YgaU